jgi:hypothetical protein
MKQRLTLITRILFLLEYYLGYKYLPETGEHIPNRLFYWRAEDFFCVRKIEIIDDEQGAGTALYMTSDEIANYII